MKYTSVIGLEIHVELNTKTKMFCSCPADYFGKSPNTHTCPVCLGLPGALPFANKEALVKCAMIGLVLNCKISKDSYFERKNYFYPDLPKGYQISQYRYPLCTGGYMVLSSGKKIRVNRVHQEEDTGKLSHSGSVTRIDFNRSGVPLVEMVTEPDFETVGEVVEFAKTFQQIVRDLGVSNADMERGDLRLEANISLSIKDTVHRSQEYPDYRIELKNINSFRFMQHAIEYEINRQSEELNKGIKLVQETRGWNEDKKESYLQRSKEDAHDYRYFPEPDLPVIEFSVSDIERIKSEMGELGSKKAERLTKEYEILQATGKILVTQGIADYFEAVMKIDRSGLSAQDVANMLVNKRIDTKSTPEEFIRRIKEIKTRTALSEDKLEEIVKEVIRENKSAVENYIQSLLSDESKKGNAASLQYLIGQVMNKSKGQADPNRARQIILDKLS